jgi:hypothetical protein
LAHTGSRTNRYVRNRPAAGKEVNSLLCPRKHPRTNTRGRFRPFCPLSGTSPAEGPAEVKLAVAIHALGLPLTG